MEFVILLPTLLLLVGLILPLVRFAIYTPWIDERLWLDQFIHQDQGLQQELEDAHERSLVPVYFSSKDLSRSQKTETFGFPFPLPGIPFPGSLDVESLRAGWDEKPGFFLDEGKLPEHISRDFSMVKKTSMPEGHVPELVHDMSLSRFLDAGTGLFESLKLDIFHLNLDILPDEKKEEK